MSSKSLADRTPFWGFKTITELRYLSQVLNNKVQDVSVNKDCFRELLKVLAQSLMENNQPKSSNQTIAKLNSISEKHKLPIHDIIMIFSSLLKIRRLMLRNSSIKSEIIKDDLIEFLKLPSDYAINLVELMNESKREAIVELAPNKSCSQSARVKSMAWRVDVSISTSSLSRTLEPFIIIELVLSNGKVVSFETPVNTFHLLRFNVALVLKEMNDLLNKPIFKLVD